MTTDGGGDRALPDPEQLIAALLAAGFCDAGGRAGLYRRMRWPKTRDGRDASLIVPLDLSYADARDMLEGAVGELRLVAEIGRIADAALAELGLSESPTDDRSLRGNPDTGTV